MTVPMTCLAHNVLGLVAERPALSPELSAEEKSSPASASSSPGLTRGPTYDGSVGSSRKESSSVVPVAAPAAGTLALRGTKDLTKGEGMIP